MKGGSARHTLTITPFALLAATTFASHWTKGTGFLFPVSLAWGLSFLWCLMLVPFVSRLRLWLGYAAMIFLGMVLVLLITFDWGDINISFD